MDSLIPIGCTFLIPIGLFLIVMKMKEHLFNNMKVLDITNKTFLQFVLLLILLEDFQVGNM